MKAQVDPNSAVELHWQCGAHYCSCPPVAAVHQLGLRDGLNKGGVEVQCPKRELPGEKTSTISQALSWL